MSLSAEQHRERATGLGGSDAGAACGISRWKTPVELWLEKTGQAEPANLDDVEFVQWGARLEDVIADEWSRRQGKKVRRRNQTIRDRELDFMVANIDRDVVGIREGLECKNSSAWVAQEWGEDGTDDVPLYYLIQGAHYMRVLDYEAWNFAVLLGGNELRSYRIERDPEVESTLIDLETRFWDCVQSTTPPPALNMDDLVRLHPKSHGAILATEEIALLVAELGRVKDEKKGLEKREEELKFRVGEYMGAAGDLLDPNDPSITIATYRSQTSNRFDTKAFRKDDPETASLYTQPQTTRRFLVK